MDIKELDIEQFIDEVRKHQCIWNLHCEDHRIATKKAKAWEAVSEAFVENYSELAAVDRVEISKKLQYKFRNLRDAYVRSIKRKDGTKPYLYEKNLSFLGVCYGDKHKNRNCSDSDDDDSDDCGPLRKKIKQEPTTKLRDPHTSFNIDYLAANSEEIEPLVHVINPPKEFDDDRMYFESLLPLIRHFDVDQKLMFRTEVLGLISKIRKCERTNYLDS